MKTLLNFSILLLFLGLASSCSKAIQIEKNGMQDLDLDLVAPGRAIKSVRPLRSFRAIAH